MDDLFSTIRDFLSSRDRPLIVILGPTASGKTALSLDIAREFDCEVISADSRQVYRHMDIGTDKIMPDERAGISHHMIDIADPDERFTVADFKSQACAVIEDILRRGKVPILCGGTGLYIRSIVENFDIPEGENFDLRRTLYDRLTTEGAEKLHEELRRMDPESARKIDPRNHRFLVRALEINHMRGGPKNDRKKPPLFDILQIGVAREREELHRLINKRIIGQIERGLVNEVRKLLDMGYAPDLASMTSLGYREIVQYLRGEISLDKAIELIKRHTRQYAKRQLTWFRRDRDVTWTP